MKSIEELWTDPRVALTQLDSPDYSDELMRAAITDLSKRLGWFTEAGPFGQVIEKGARVVIKPNLVLHRNQGPWGVQPLITHPALVRAIAEAALQAGASQVLIGDAPLQSCDFESLMQATGLTKWSDELKSRDSSFKGIRDFRRTTCGFIDGVRVASEGLQSEDGFLLFDLADQSLLEDVCDSRAPFRVTCYDPRLLSERHHKGRHQYLVAKEIIEADVVINLPKLKTHKKAGITCALKNLVGINGNKEYLPHHRVGGLENGGDCYPGKSTMKSALEFALDQQNMSASHLSGKLWSEVATSLDRVLRFSGDTLGVEGSHSRNDTVWRTCLDLNRILLYGQTDATLADKPQRKVIHVVDAIVAGQGNGPLAPQALSLGTLFAGANAAAVDWTAAGLLDYDRNKVPLVKEAFGEFRWRITNFEGEDVILLNAGQHGARERQRVIHPDGWRDASMHS